eukprot:gene1585-12675_t
MTHDNTAAVLTKCRGLADGMKILNTEQPFIGLDHDIQNTTEVNLAKY